MTESLIYARPPDERREYVDRFASKMVEVEVKYWPNPRRGRVVCVAVPSFGTVADMLILETNPNNYPKAISLASLRTIREVE